MAYKENLSKVLNLRYAPDQIRNISIIAHVDHGKTTLADTLLARCGVISEKVAGTGRALDNNKIEQERGITIKSTGISLAYHYPAQDKDFLINLVDSPGHVDFSSEVTAALRITDGALVVVDSVEGVCVQTGTVLRQALIERIRPVLMINKVDRLITELQKDPEDAYLMLRQAVDEVNQIISTLQDDLLGDATVDPRKGTVCFGSGKEGWAFSIPLFAERLAKKANKPASYFTERLWGDWFWDEDAKSLSVNPVSPSGKPRKRFFCKAILEPIYKIYQHCKENNFQELHDMMAAVQISLNAEKEMTGKELQKNVMKKFLPASDAIFAMIINHLPSPKVAQQYRVHNLYAGPPEDEYAQAIKDCNPDGPLMMFVSKMVEQGSTGRFTAFGRVFSGTVKAGQKVVIFGPEYNPPDKKDDVFQGSVQRTVLMMNANVEAVDDCPCGNTIGLVGVDNFIVKSATITNAPNAFPLTAMKFSVSPVVRVAVEPKNPIDLVKFVEALRRLVRSDPCVQCKIEETGQHIIACAGELHLEVILQNLREQYCPGMPLVVSDPVVSFRETITAPSSVNCLAKSTNKLNRVYAQAEPMNKDLVEALDTHKLDSILGDLRARTTCFAEQYGWDPEAAKKIWCFGPQGGSTTNCLVDMTKGVQYLTEVKDSIVNAFQSACDAGPVCEETMRGVRINLTDVMLHSDSNHRGGRQIIPATRKVINASVMSATPAIMEPIYAVEIQTTERAISGIYSVFNKRRGQVVETKPTSGSICVVKGYLPVLESFGLTAALREATSGEAFPQCVFDHWEVLPGSPFEAGTKANQVAVQIRKRKGLKEAFPVLDDYLDRL